MAGGVIPFTGNSAVAHDETVNPRLNTGGSFISAALSQVRGCS